MEENNKKPSILERLFSPEIVRLIRFTLIGGINTAVDYGVFFLLHTLLSVGSLIAQVISFSSGVICSYFLNRHFTFKAQNKIHFPAFYRKRIYIKTLFSKKGFVNFICNMTANSFKCMRTEKKKSQQKLSE